METVLTNSFLKQPTLVRLMMVVALVVLPSVAWVDYQQQFYFSMGVELFAAATLMVMILLIRRLGVDRSIQVTLILMFFLAVLGSVEKLDSTPNFAWFSVMPFLYISIGGLRLGGLLTAGHFFLIALCYLSFAAESAAALDSGTWLQVSLAYLTAAGLAVSYEYGQRQLRNRLHALADHDSLTGLLNRRGMEKRLEELAGFLERHKVPVVLALLDIDHFKKVNDAHGHDVGDAVLRELARELTRVFRNSDYIARWGGEEFLVALTNAHLEEGTAVLERLRSEIANSSAFSVPSITLSMGAALWHAEIDLVSALKQADQALYGAKHQGRNTLVPAVRELAASSRDLSSSGSGEETTLQRQRS
jgi:diguanylate cyclase (GGDEF)-like protein